jgi:hypothetical protein
MGYYITCSSDIIVKSTKMKNYIPVNAKEIILEDLVS